MSQNPFYSEMVVMLIYGIPRGPKVPFQIFKCDFATQLPKFKSKESASSKEIEKSSWKCKKSKFENMFL